MTYTRGSAQDLAVTILPVSHPNLEMEPLGSGRLVCICPYNHPLARRATLSVADLLPFPLISYDRESPFGAMVGALFEASGETVRAEEIPAEWLDETKEARQAIIEGVAAATSVRAPPDGSRTETLP